MGSVQVDQTQKIGGCRPGHLDSHARSRLQPGPWFGSIRSASPAEPGSPQRASSWVPTEPAEETPPPLVGHCRCRRGRHSIRPRL